MNKNFLKSFLLGSSIGQRWVVDQRALGYCQCDPRTIVSSATMLPCPAKKNVNLWLDRSRRAGGVGSCALDTFSGSIARVWDCLETLWKPFLFENKWACWKTVVSKKGASDFFSPPTCMSKESNVFCKSVASLGKHLFCWEIWSSRNCHQWQKPPSPVLALMSCQV